MLGFFQVALVEKQVAELPLGPGNVLRTRRASSRRPLHRRDRAGSVAHQLPSVRDARKGREVGTEVDHRLEGGDRLWVLAQLDLGVADHTVGGGVVGVSCPSPLAPTEGVGEPMAGERDGSLSNHGRDVTGIDLQRLREECLGLWVVARVARLPGFLQVSLAERRRCRTVVRVVP